MGKQWKQWTEFIFLSSKITADGDCSHEIKRHLLLGRKAMTNLDSILKNRDITLPTKVHLVKVLVFPVVMYGWESWTIKKANTEELMLLNCGVGEDSWESLGLQDQTTQSWRKSALNIHWKEWCWSWSSNTLATWCEELTHWKRPWCWESLKAGGEGNDRGWDGWMASPTRLTWVWASPGICWWTRKPGVLQSVGSQSRTRLSNWTELYCFDDCSFVVKSEIRAPNSSSSVFLSQDCFDYLESFVFS